MQHPSRPSLLPTPQGINLSPLLRQTHSRPENYSKHLAHYFFLSFSLFFLYYFLFFFLLFFSFFLLLFFHFFSFFEQTTPLFQLISFFFINFFFYLLTNQSFVLFLNKNSMERRCSKRIFKIISHYKTLCNHQFNHN